MLERTERGGTNSLEDNGQIAALKVLQQQIQVSNVYRATFLIPNL